MRGWFRELPVCPFFEVFDRIARISFKYGVKLEVARNLIFIKVKSFSIRLKAPIQKLSKVCIEELIAIYIRHRTGVFDEQRINNLVIVRVDELYIPILVLQVHYAIDVIAVGLPLDDIPANRRRFVQLDIHQIGNLRNGGRFHDILCHVRIDIVSPGNNSRSTRPSGLRADDATAHGIVVTRLCKIAARLNLADKELRTGPVGDWIGDQGIRFHQPIATTPACPHPFGGCRYLLIELVVLTIDRPAVEIFAAQIDRVLIVAGDERHRRTIITIINKRRRQRPLYVITSIRLVISDPDRFSVLRIAIFLPLGNQRQIAGHLNRFADFVFLAICIFVMRQVVVDRRKHVVQHGRRCPRLVRVVNGRIYRVANACCIAVLIGIFLCVVRIVRFIYQAVTRVCHRHHSKRCERVAAAGICTCDLRRASAQAGHNPILNGCDPVIVRTPFTFAAIYHLGAASRHQRSDECLAGAHGDHC